MKYPKLVVVSPAHMFVSKNRHIQTAVLYLSVPFSLPQQEGAGEYFFIFYFRQNMGFFFI